MGLVMSAGTIEDAAHQQFEILLTEETLEDLFWREDWTGLARMATVLEYKAGRPWTAEEYVRDLEDDLEYIQKYLKYGDPTAAAKMRIWDAIISDERRLAILWVGILFMLTAVADNGSTMMDLPTKAKLATLTAVPVQRG